jgi:GT2 family glycosyltransferase
MNLISISIIIPTCNRPEDLRQCLQALDAQIAPTDGIEILVCDDGQNADARKMMEEAFPRFRWNQGPRKGPAANRNGGAKMARGQWLIFIDDDCLPRPTLIPAYRASMERLGAGARVALEGATHRIGEKPSLLWEAPHNPNGGALISCNFAIPKELFWEIGAFDERFPGAAFEDTEFATRAKIMGVEVEFVRDAAVDHPLRPLPHPRKLASRWEARVISSYDFGAKPWQVLWHLPRHVLLVIISRLRNQKLTRSNLKAIFMFVLEFLIFLQKLPAWNKRHQRTPRSPFWSHPSRAPFIPQRFGL